MNDWEPIPWDMGGDAAAEQARGFRRRAASPIAWTPVPFAAFPPGGLFGQGRDWFASNDVGWAAVFDGEDLILVSRLWHGWPDPPEFALASRPTGADDSAWMWWGSFDVLPAAWSVPGGT